MGAVGKERRVPFSSIELPGVDLAEQRQELRCRPPIGVNDATCFKQSVKIRQLTWCGQGHGSVVAREFQTGLVRAWMLAGAPALLVDLTCAIALLVTT